MHAGVKYTPKFRVAIKNARDKIELFTNISLRYYILSHADVKKRIVAI